MTQPATTAHGDSASRSRIVWAFTGFMVQRPLLTFGLLTSIISLITSTAFAANLIVLSEGSPFDWYINDAAEVENLDAMLDAQNDVDPLRNTTGGQQQFDTYAFPFHFAFEVADDELIFTPENLQTICEVESLLVKAPDFDSYCKRASSTECQLSPTSVTQHFYSFPNISAWSCYLLSGEHVDQVWQNLQSTLSTPTGLALLGLFVGSDWRDTNSSSRTQSIWPFGAPLEGYDSPEADARKQRQEYREFLVDNVETELFDTFEMHDTGGVLPHYPSPYRTKASRGGVDVRWFNYLLNQQEMQRIIRSDLIFSGAAIIFVFLWIAIHLRSTALALLAMMQIVLSLPVSLVVYIGVYQIPYVTEFHMLVIFLTLGIGADDVFVFMDTWKSSAEHWKGVAAKTGAPDAQKIFHSRLYATVMHSASAIFNTSFTTAFAFMATGFSPLTPISTFGYFAATAIVVNFAFVCTVTPAGVVLYEKFLSGIGAKKTKPAPGPQHAGSNSGSGEDGIIEKFYIPLFTRRPRIFPIIAVCSLIGYGVHGFIHALRLEPPTDQEEFFPPDHMFTGFATYLLDNYLSADESAFVAVTVLFGISGIDRSGFNPYIPSENRGSAKFDNDYELADPDCQRAFLEACSRIRSFTCDTSGCDPYGTLALPDTTVCFLEEFRDYLNQTEGVDSFTLPREGFYSRLSDFRRTTHPAGDPFATWEKLIGFIDGDLRFAAIEYTSTLRGRQTVKIKRPVLDRTNDYVDAVKDTPQCSRCDCGSLRQVTRFDWPWLRTEEGLVASFYQGLAIAMPVAFVVLLASTGNIILSLYAILTVVMIVVGVLGVIEHNLGWSLGITESVVGVIVVGFSVDYTIHLGHAYDTARLQGLPDRISRFMFASRTMVLTVVAGAITTAGAGCVMFGAQLTFFGKMATLISATIALSYLYALVFFMALLVLVGPERDQGNIGVWIAKLPSMARDRSVSQVAPASKSTN